MHQVNEDMNITSKWSQYQNMQTSASIWVKNGLIEKNISERS